MGCSAPLADADHAAIRRVAEALALELRPATRAYHEIWLDGRAAGLDRAGGAVLRDQYLPRKFKTAVGLSTDNCVDIYAQDVGLLAIVRDGPARRVQPARRRRPRHDPQQGRYHGPAGRAARLRAGRARRRGRAHRGRASSATTATARDRRHARLKYLLAEWGIARFREEFQRRASFTLAPGGARSRGCRSTTTSAATARRDGRWFYGVFIQSGRIVDSRGPRAQDRAARDRHPALARHSPHRPAEPAAHRSRRRRASTRRADAAGSRRPACRTSSRRCGGTRWPAPRCRRAASPSPNRSARSPASSTSSRPSSTASGLRDVPLTIRMTGCPNGCARPYTADLAFVGRSHEPLQRVRRRRPGRRPAGGSLPRRRTDGRAARPPCGRCSTGGPPSAPSGEGLRRLLPAAHGPPRGADRGDRPRAADHRAHPARGGASERPRPGARGARLAARTRPPTHWSAGWRSRSAAAGCSTRWPWHSTRASRDSTRCSTS